jgi:hypothetical protein
MGQRYEIAEWLDFIVEPEGEASPEAVKVKDEFQSAVAELWDGMFHSLSPSSYDDLAYNTFASFAGMGVGLWEDDEPGHLEFEPVAMADEGLQQLAWSLELAIHDCQQGEG